MAEMMNKLPPSGKVRWAKTWLKVLEKSPKAFRLGFKGGELILTNTPLENDARTRRNAMEALAKDPGRAWNVQYFETAAGARFVMKILTDDEAREEKLAVWQNRKLYREGFATANPFLA